MPRLRTPRSLPRVLGNFALGLFGVCLFFGWLYLAALNDSRDNLQRALADRAAAAEGNDETRLQRAARAVCADHPERDGRRVEPRWTPEGQLECLVVVAQEAAQ